MPKPPFMRGFSSDSPEVRIGETQGVEQKGFELAAPRSVMLGKLSATLAQYLAKRKAPVLERISSPEIRLSFLNLCAFSSL